MPKMIESPNILGSKIGNSKSEVVGFGINSGSEKPAKKSGKSKG